MSFVANPPASTIPSVAADQVDGDGWWPSVSIADFRDALRLPETVTGIRVRDAVVKAMIWADGELTTWRSVQEAAGSAKLEDVAGASFGGETRALSLWRQAVYAWAAADLTDTHHDISATESGRDRRFFRSPFPDDLRRDATAAIRALIGAAHRVRLV